MLVVVDGGSGSVVLEDAENLRALSVELRSCSPADAADLLADLGHFEGEHVWLDIARLRDLSPLADDPEWTAGFEGVMSYADSKGWLDASRSRVRAHVTG